MLHRHLQPSARHSAIAGIHGERLKIRISAPPVDGKANAELIGLLSRAFGVGKGDVRIRHGKTGRQKTVAIVDPSTLPAAADIGPPGALSS